MTATGQYRDLSIIDSITWAVKTYPALPAVRTANGVLTYSELGDVVTAFSSMIHEATAPGEFIAIKAERNVASIAALLAALGAGRPFVFLDPRDSDGRNAEKADLLGIRFISVSTDNGVAPRLIDLPHQWLPTETKTPVVSNDRQIAYAIHTSGSTGQPKCVVVALEQLGSVIEDHVTRLGLGPGSRTLQFARLTFDGCLTEILWSLTSGACLVVVDETDLAPGDTLAHTLATFGITHLKTTPFALTATEPNPAMSLKHVINGGGACRPAVVRKWGEVSAVHNAYGLTETTICNFLSDDLRGTVLEPAVPLGTFVGSGGFEVLAEDSNHPFTRGELVLRGDCVAIGYLTSDGIVRLEEDGRAAFKSGDIVERIEDNLYFVERKDRQLKIRGFRIDPGEVETAACRHRDVIEAVAVPESHDENGEPVLVLYFQGNVSGRELRSHLKLTLEEYKVPSVISEIEAIPYTLNGKVDKDALRSIRRSPDGPPIPSQSAALSHPLLFTVRSLTGVADANPQDNFFDIGGDSASALVLVTELRKLGWLSAGARDVLRAPNMQWLIDRVDSEAT